ncbi:LOW QUALITY PROTEIN: GON7 isoform 2, partial [Pan troglodytes]
LGEYVGQEGKPQKLRVSCEAPGDGDPFQGLLSGVAQMKDMVMMKMMQKMKITLITELTSMDHLQNGQHRLNNSLHDI